MKIVYIIDDIITPLNIVLLICKTINTLIYEISGACCFVILAFHTP